MESETAKAHRKARQREYYRKHRDKILAQSRKFIQDHPEKIKEYHKNAARKRENGTGYYQRYYALNKDKLLEYAKNWRKRNPEKVKEYQQRYNRKMAAERKERRERKSQSQSQPNIAKAKSLFRNPAQAEHLQWLLNHAASKKQENKKQESIHQDAVTS